MRYIMIVNIYYYQMFVETEKGLRKKRLFKKNNEPSLLQSVRHQDRFFWPRNNQWYTGFGAILI